MADKEDDDRFALSDSEKRAFFDLNLTGEMPSSRRRQLALPLVFFYLSAMALITLSYFFSQHIIAEFAVMHSLELELARQEFLKRILKGAAFVIAITVAVVLNRFFTLVLLISFVIGVSGLADDFTARLVASPDIFDPVNMAVLLTHVAYVVTINRMLYLVIQPN